MQNLFHGPCGNNESYLIKPKENKTKLSNVQKQTIYNQKTLRKRHSVHGTVHRTIPIQFLLLRN